MKNIDFLPQELIWQSEARAQRYWWLVVGCGLTTLMAFGIGLQSYQIWKVRDELARVQPLSQQATELEQQVATAQAELAQANRHATLLAQLESDWPRTVILGQILPGIPPRTQLADLQIRFEAAAVNVPSAGTEVVVSGDQATAQDPLQTALDTFRTRAASRRLILEMSGTTREPGGLHRYVSELPSRTLVASAKLQTLEALPQSTYAEQKFTIRVEIRPSFGLPGGPTPAAAKSDSERVAQASSGAPE